MSKREDIAYLTACIKSSNDTLAMEQVFIEIVELLAKGTSYKQDIAEAIEHYNVRKGRR